MNETHENSTRPVQTSEPKRVRVDDVYNSIIGNVSHNAGAICVDLNISFLKKSTYTFRHEVAVHVS